MNGTTQCSGDDPSPSNVPNTTCAVEWYYARSGGNLPPSTLQIQPVWLNGTPSRHVIPRERMRVEESSQVADFILCWFIIQRGGFLHSADAAVGMTMLVRFYGFAHCFYSILRRPAALIRLAQASQLPPREALVPCRAAYRFILTS